MLYRIGDFSKRVDTSIRTLRYYDELDILKPLEIDLFTGYRYYSGKQEDDFKTIKYLQEAGFSLDEIRQYNNNFNDSILQVKKSKLLGEMEDIKKKIRGIDYLRSNLTNGKFIFIQPIKPQKNKSKTIYK